MLTDQEQMLMACVASDQGWGVVEKFAATRREQPEEYEVGARWLADRLDGLGFSVSVEKPSIYLGLPMDAMVQCEGVTYRTKAAALSPWQGPIAAPLVHVPARDGASRVHTNDPALLFDGAHTRDSLRLLVRGNIVITEGLSNPGRSELLEALGALAIITINPGDAVHWGASSTVWGSPGLADVSRLPGIVSMAVSNPDGARLVAAAMRKAPVTVAADMRHGWFEQSLPIVDIKATGDHAHEFVLLHGHLDSWDLGVGDNATGDAVLLEVGRALMAQRASLKRSVRIAWWPGHSAGRYGGSTWFADRFAHDLRAKCVAHLNCDSPGCRDATDYSSIRGMAETQPLVAGAVQDLFGQTCRLERPSRVGDYSFNNLGISGTLLTSSMVPAQERKRRGWYSVGGNGGSPTWHTEDDLIDVAQRSVLENDARLYALLISRLAFTDTPLLDYRLALAQISTRIEQTRGVAGIDLEPHAYLAGHLASQLEASYVPGASSPQAGAWPGLLAASRSIVRAGYAENGPFQQDPAFAQSAVPMLSAAESASTHPPARISLQRGANQLRQELQDAVDTLARG